MGVKKAPRPRRFLLCCVSSVSEVRANELHQGVHGVLLIGAVGNEVDGAALDDAQGEDTEQTFGVDPLLVLLHPNGALEFVCLLNKEGSRSRVKADLIIDSCLLDIHNSPSRILSLKCYHKNSKFPGVRQCQFSWHSTEFTRFFCLFPL